MARTLRDLCSTCFYSPMCVRLGTAGRPVFECEEFSQQGNGFRWAAEDLPLEAPGRQTSNEKSEGLCSDCANRKRCALRVSEGGVWHCEEYR